jgi:HEAT repeat protein
MRVRARFILLLCLLMSGGCGKAQKSTDELISDLKSGKSPDRIAASRLLLHRKGDAAKVVPVLIESLKDKQTDVRLSAAAGLGEFGEEAKSAIPQLQATTKDKDVRVRRAAGNALARIDPSLAPPADPSKPPAK